VALHSRQALRHNIIIPPLDCCFFSTVAEIYWRNIKLSSPFKF
jgi:hypothetical protein